MPLTKTSSFKQYDIDSLNFLPVVNLHKQFLSQRVEVNVVAHMVAGYSYTVHVLIVQLGREVIQFLHHLERVDVDQQHRHIHCFDGVEDVRLDLPLETHTRGACCQDQGASPILPGVLALLPVRKITENDVVAGDVAEDEGGGRLNFLQLKQETCKVSGHLFDEELMKRKIQMQSNQTI
jgi:hypothetical protein